MNDWFEECRKQAQNAMFKQIKEANPTVSNIGRVVESVLDNNKNNLAGMKVLDLERWGDPEARKRIVAAWRDEYTSQMGVVFKSGRILTCADWKPWVQQAMADGRLIFPSYELYREHLAGLGKFSAASLEAIDRSTMDVLDHMGDPKQPGSFQTFGLMMGDVQSGKTATFTGICHRAADAGYRLILVLTGTKSTLRSQTQARLNSDLIGISTDTNGVNKPSFQSPYHWNQLTTADSDFVSANVSKHASTYNENVVHLAVIQKNDKVLSNILAWIRNSAELGVRRLPFLLVDDEADSASVNVSKSSKNPTTINGQIREVLRQFDRAAYLAVTATPFANVFIDPQIDPETGEVQEDIEKIDLFPRDYIYAIPTPGGYVGVERLFGETGEEEHPSLKYRTLIPMLTEGERSGEEEGDDYESEVFREKFKADDEVMHIPLTLRKAVLYFLCVCAMKQMRFPVSTNTSMLVHIAKYRKVQSDLRNLIADLVQEVTDLNENERSRVTGSLLANDLYVEMQEIWNNGLNDEKWHEDPHDERPPTLKELTGIEWSEVWKSHFGDALVGVEVVEANMNSKIRDFASFYENNDARLIVVGGDALSRGLTLEGLCVSYFSRRSFAYDTLLQMGRWFGFREGMRDYMKIWISDGMVEAFEYVARALNEFRDTVRLMMDRKRQPKDFGLKIRRAPSHLRLMVTAPNKRRTAKTVVGFMDITGMPYQSATFPVDPRKLEDNYRKVVDFLNELGPATVRPDSRFPNDLVWEGVPAEQVTALLVAFEVPSWTWDIDIAAVAAKIAERKEAWNVRVISTVEANGEPLLLDGVHPVYCVRRTMIKKTAWIQQRNKAILSRRDFARHWTKDHVAEVLDGRPEDAVMTPRIVLSQEGERPQLLIYPVRTMEITEEKRAKLKPLEPYEQEKPFMALAFGLPSAEDMTLGEVRVTYDANKIYQMRKEDGYVDGEDE